VEKIYHIDNTKTDENRKLKVSIPGKNSYLGKKKKGKKSHLSIQRETVFQTEISGKLKK